MRIEKDFAEMLLDILDDYYDNSKVERVTKHLNKKHFQMQTLG